MWRIALLLLLPAASAPAWPAAAEPVNRTELTLELWCRSDLEEHRIACRQYLLGVADGLTAAQAFGQSKLCTDASHPVSPDHLRRVFVEWSAEHPEYREHPAVNAAVAALVSAFPCPPAH